MSLNVTSISCTRIDEMIQRNKKQNFSSCMLCDLLSRKFMCHMYSNDLSALMLPRTDASPYIAITTLDSSLVCISALFLFLLCSFCSASLMFLDLSTCHFYDFVFCLNAPNFLKTIFRATFLYDPRISV